MASHKLCHMGRAGHGLGSVQGGIGGVLVQQHDLTVLCLFIGQMYHALPLLPLKNAAFRPHYTIALSTLFAEAHVMHVNDAICISQGMW